MVGKARISQQGRKQQQHQCLLGSQKCSPTVCVISKMQVRYLEYLHERLLLN